MATKTTVTTPARNPPHPLGCGCLGWIFTNVAIVVTIVIFARFIDTEPFRIRLAQLFTGNQIIVPRDLVPPQMKYESVQLFDTDADEEEERVLFYRYNPAPDSPFYGVTVLDFNQCQPRRVDSFDIIEVEDQLLTSEKQNMETMDIPDVGGPHDFLLWGLTDKRHAELSIFYWYDNEPGACVPTTPATRGYLNLGSFRGSDGIEIDGKRVRVKERIFERSQISWTRVYEPINSTYRSSQTGPMLPPVVSAVEFTVTPQPDKPGPHYPERAVLKFYVNIGVNTEEAKKVLDAALVDQHIVGKDGKDVAQPGQLTTMAEVKEIDYNPDVAKEQRCERVPVVVKVIHSRPDGSTTGPNTYRVWVEGYPDTNALPYGCEWRIVGFEYLD